MPQDIATVKDCMLEIDVWLCCTDTCRPDGISEVSIGEKAFVFKLTRLLSESYGTILCVFSYMKVFWKVVKKKEKE